MLVIALSILSACKNSKGPNENAAAEARAAAIVFGGKWGSSYGPTDTKIDKETTITESGSQENVFYDDGKMTQTQTDKFTITNRYKKEGVKVVVKLTYKTTIKARWQVKDRIYTEIPMSVEYQLISSNLKVYDSRSGQDITNIQDRSFIKEDTQNKIDAMNSLLDNAKQEYMSNGEQYTIVSTSDDKITMRDCEDGELWELDRKQISPEEEDEVFRNRKKRREEFKKREEESQKVQEKNVKNFIRLIKHL